MKDLDLENRELKIENEKIKTELMLIMKEMRNYVIRESSDIDKSDYFKYLSQLKVSVDSLIKILEDK